MKKISVIIPAYNASSTIDETIKSVLNQTITNIELIVIDDNSSDNTLEVLKKYKNIKVLKNKKRLGPALTRNRGIEISTGSFIAFIDADDIWDKYKLERQLPLAHNHSFTYTGYKYSTGKRVKVPSHITYHKLLKNTTIFTSTVIFNMDLLSKEDIYMPNIGAEDTGCWLKVLKKCDAYGLDSVLATYNRHIDSYSSNKLVALKKTWELYKYEGISLLPRIYYFICYLFNAVRRRI